MKMKCAATFALALTAGAAQAQSSVTLYGIAEVGVNYVSNAGGGRQFNMVSGEWYGSRFGLKGSEDLGGGLTAIFRLENGFDITNGKLGQNGLLFGRAAYVGISSTQWGTITAGRQYSTVFDFVGANIVASGRWGGGFIAHAGDVDNLNNTFRVNSSLKYQSVSYHGFTFGGLYSFGGVGGNFAKNSGWGAGIGYALGPLQAAVAFTDMRDPFISAYNNGANAPAAITSPIYNAYASAGSLKIFSTGAIYQLGSLWFGGTYSNARFTDLGADPGNPGAVAALRGTASLNTYEADLGYQFTPSLSASAAYNYTRRASVGGDEGATYNQYSLGADYLLSKRTDLYMVLSYQTASGVNSNGKPAVAALNFLTPATVDHQGVVRLAIRHQF
ncbi:porin [Paraburkholderia sp.]|uniref:porin n=1 Tax=Paraburkholderia sp. TaxID=1926495 RepID=UPI0039E572EE